MNTFVFNVKSKTPLLGSRSWLDQSFYDPTQNVWNFNFIQTHVLLQPNMEFSASSHCGKSQLNLCQEVNFVKIKVPAWV